MKRASSVGVRDIEPPSKHRIWLFDTAACGPQQRSAAHLKPRVDKVLAKMAR
jgi:hypothetical protein